jgi:hypothetical protein
VGSNLELTQQTLQPVYPYVFVPEVFISLLHFQGVRVSFLHSLSLLPSCFHSIYHFIKEIMTRRVEEEGEKRK